MFKEQEKKEAIDSYATNGFVSFVDLLSPDEISELISEFDNTDALSGMSLSNSTSSESNDAIFISPIIEKLCKHPVLVKTAKALLGANDIELQHSKINIKKTSNKKESFELHQDFPFFPHTNFDLLACAIHLDEQTEASGPIELISGSHKWGALSHVKDGEFAYHCTEKLPVDDIKYSPLIGPAGMVSFHHCLTMHRSSPMTKKGRRRILFYQYRAKDSIQLAGVVWKSTGYQVEANAIDSPRRARFSNGESVELRGKSGRLIDRANAFKPDN